MVPYGDIDFFLFTGVCILLALAVGFFTKSNTWLQGIVLFYTFSFFVFAYNTNKLPALIIYFCTTYLIIYLFTQWFRKTPAWLVCVFLLLPLLGVRLQPIDQNLFQYFDFFSILGLSFATFRAIQFYLDYILIKAIPNPIVFFVFLFNPTWMMIGPIDTYQNFSENWRSIAKNITAKNVSNSLDYFVLGLAQNMVLARLTNDFILHPLEQEPLTGLGCYVQMLSYFVYLYFDFAGYSNMAKGLSGLFGLPLPINFNIPFLARNPQDFWKRWHITLSDWLKNYFFKPYYVWINSFQRLKKYPMFKQNSGLFLTFVLMGAWNGFSKHYIISGVFFGLLSVGHNVYLQKCRKAGRDLVFANWNPTLVHVASVILMLHLNAFGLYLFSGLLIS